MAGPFKLFPGFSLFRTRRKVRDGLMRRYTVSNPYHAVSISAKGGMCDAAKECKGKRFLSADAPQLPLAGCDAANCACKYAHHDDRRAGPRRTSDVAHRMNHLWRGEERRRDGGRRITDL